jgi:hypothetical protein
VSNITKETIEQTICNPIIDHASEGYSMSGSTLGGIIDTVRELVKERDQLLADIASNTKESNV